MRLASSLSVVEQAQIRTCLSASSVGARGRNIRHGNIHQPLERVAEELDRIAIAS
jgi:hypothetical protein